MPTVDVSKVASFLNLTETRIQQLVKEGMPKEARGQYDPIKCAHWYIRYLQSALEKKSLPTPEGGYAGEREERVRLVRAEADLKEMELAKERSLLVPIPEIEKAIADLVLTTKARMMAIPPRVAPDLVGETSRVMIQAKLEKAIKEALAYLAKAGPTNVPADPSERAG